MREKLIQFLKKELEFETNFDNILEIPKQRVQGDFSLPCFVFAKELKKNPFEISKELSQKLSNKNTKFISKIENVGPYINFFLDPIVQAEEILKSISSKKIYEVKFQKEKILIEYPSPNTNKDLHVGHLRNILLGNVIGNLLIRAKHKVIRTNLYNDRGIAICKAMLMYMMYGEGKTPRSEKIKPDVFVSNYYILFGEEVKKNPNLEKEALEMLKRWEEGDSEIIGLWKKLIKWVYEGYSKTFKRLKVKEFDKNYYESEIYDKGKEIVLKALAQRVKGFKKEKNGAILCDFENEVFGKKYLLRGNGTTVYMTQDLYLASLKEKDFRANKNIFIVSKEQEYHFQVLFELFERIGIGKKTNNLHYAYGYIYNKEGKKFSSRLGNTISADEILDDSIRKAYDNLKIKEISKNLNEKELIRRSEVIGYSALSFAMLRVNPMSDINLDVEKSLSMTGETGPYVQYTYARIKSILRKSGVKKLNVNYDLFEEEKEINLIKELGKYNSILHESIRDLKPSDLCQYLIKLSQEFNSFYQEVPVLNIEKEVSINRLYLIENVAKVIKDGLELLDIEVLEEM